MTSPSISDTTVASRAHLVERTAAFAALAAAALYIIQPVLVFGLTPLLPEIPEYATAAEAASATWQASLEAGLFFGIGVAFVVFAVACGRAIDPHREGGVALQVAGGFGLLAGGASLLFAGTFTASAGVGGWADVAAATDDADAQRTVVQVLEAVGIGTLAGIALLTAATIAAVSVAARRTRSAGPGRRRHGLGVRHPDRGLVDSRASARGAAARHPMARRGRDRVPAQVTPIGPRLTLVLGHGARE